MSKILDYIPLVSFSPGRARYALKRLMERPAVNEDATLRMLIERGDQLARACAKAERRWRVRRALPYARGRAVALDAQLDRAIAALHVQLVSRRDMYGLDDPLGQRAADLLQRHLPEGVGGITLRVFEDEIEVVESLLGALRGPDREAVEQLQLGAVIDVIETRLPLLRAEIEREPAERITFDEVRVARVAMQRGLVRVIAALVVGYGEPEQASVFAELMGPIEEQADRIRALRRSRRQVFDVDPGTGAPANEPEPSEG